MNTAFPFTKEHTNLFCAHFTNNVIAPRIYIKIKGKYIQTRSKKNNWATIGHAKNALINHLACGHPNIFHKLSLDLTGDKYSLNKTVITRQFFDFLIQEGILEFELR